MDRRGFGSPIVIFLAILTITVVGTVIYYVTRSLSPGALPTNQPTNPIATTTVNSDLRSQLEAAYNNARAVLSAKGDLSAWLGVFEPNPSLSQPTADQWKYFLNAAAAGYPDLSQLHYISSEQDGDYAYYFAWVPATDKPQQYMNVWDYVFHNSSGGWKLTGYSFSDYLQQGTTAADNDQIATRDVLNLKSTVAHNLQQ